jgi:O-antigen/teichoic acid export membrane protein
MMTSRIKNGFRNKHFLSLAGNGSMAALSIATYALLYRLLPETDMGNWVFFQFVFALLDAFRTGFLQTALIKFYSGSTDERKSAIAGSTWYIAIVITAFFAFVNLPLLLALPSITDSGVYLLLKWFGLSLLFTLPFNVAFWILQADERFDRILVLRWINQGSFILYLVVLFFLHQINMEAIVYGFLGSSLLTSLIAVLAGWSKLFTLNQRTGETTKELFHFGKYSLGSYMGSSLLRSSDSIIIKFMIGPAALAVYTLAQRIGEVVEILIRSFLGTAMPSMSAAYNRNDKEQVIFLMKKYSGMLTLLLVPVIAILFFSADLLVLILGGKKYVNTEAANVLRIFMGFALIFPLDRFAGITLDIIHKPHLNFIKVILTLVINVVTDIIALKLFGNIYGAAVASFCTLTFGVCFGYFTLRKFLPFNINGVLRLGYSESKLLLSGMIRKKPVA